VSGPAELHAVVRLAADPDNRQAEFAIIVERELAGLGVGGFLLQQCGGAADGLEHTHGHPRFARDRFARDRYARTRHEQHADP
jgi:hypothetical protein